MPQFWNIFNAKYHLKIHFLHAGQVVSSEIVMGSEKGCPIEVHDIKIEKCDPMYDSECKGGKSIPFHRAGYDRLTGQSPNNPRQQVTKFFVFTNEFHPKRGLQLSVLNH